MNPFDAFHSPRRWLRLLALAGVLATSVAQAQVESDLADPPARVGRVSLLAGPVTLTDFRADEESNATLNWPITSQQRLSTGHHGRAEVRIGSTSVRMDGDTVLDFVRIDDDVIQLKLHQGTAALRIRNRDQLKEIDFLTSRERVVFEDVGRYRIDVDRVAGASALTAHVGTARVVSDRFNFVVQSGQRGELTVEPTIGFQLVAVSPDVFDDWVAARDHRDDSLRSTQYVSPETTGVESLDGYGDWRTVDSYGAVWFPGGVAVDWAPYRYGRWAYVAPWGWTWIDDAPWGFTPFHYGRWVYVRGSWGWVPGAYVARPCYAPALVAWYGAPGASIGISVGWFPLGPGEAFIPSYRYTGRYIRSVNFGHVINITNVTVINPPPRYRYRQPDYSTWAPRDAIVRSQPIHRVVQKSPTEWAKLPTAVAAPVKVPNDYGRGRATPVTVAPRDVERTPTRRVGRGDDASDRSPGPNRGAPVRGREPGRATRIETPVERVAPPATRAPRFEARQETPRREVPRTEVAPARPPKVQQVERVPAPQTGQVGAPPQQIVPRPAPAPRHEVPAQRAPQPRPREPVADDAPRAKVPAQRQPAETQR